MVTICEVEATVKDVNPSLMGHAEMPSATMTVIEIEAVNCADGMIVDNYYHQEGNCGVACGMAFIRLEATDGDNVGTREMHVSDLHGTHHLVFLSNTLSHAVVQKTFP